MAMDEEYEDFEDRVDEVTRLITGLKDGSLPADYVDRREKEIYDRESKKQEEKDKAKREEEERSFDKLPKERQDELLRKVDELQRNKERKERLRAAFRAHQTAKADEGASREGTDYQAWDLWTPSDEEDELYESLTPNSPEFKAMEKDIDERHERLLRSRQYAERQRQLGNDYFKKRMFSKALQVYEEGISAEKANMALNANAAAACIKLGCNIQAIEHCDRVMSIADFCHENKPSTIPLRLKAHQRRAAARMALGHNIEAVRDLEAALELCGGKDGEVENQLARARRAREEEKVARRLKKAAEAAGEGDGGGDGSADSAALRDLSRLSRLSAPTRESCEELRALVSKSEDARIFARESGALSRVLHGCVEAAGGMAASALGALEAACENDQNAEYVCRYERFLDGLGRRLGCNEADRDETAAIVGLLRGLSVAEEPRKLVAAEVAGNSSSLDAVCSLAVKDAGPAVASSAMQLLGNLCLHPPFRRTLSDRVSRDWDLVEGILGVLCSPDLVSVHVSAASLLGNLCNDARVRAACAKKDGLLRTLLKECRNAKSNGKSRERLGKILGVISNLAVEGANQTALCKAGAVPKMLDLLESAPSAHAAQIASCIAKLSKDAAGARALATGGSISRLFSGLLRGSEVSEISRLPEPSRDALLRASCNVILNAGLGTDQAADLLFPLGVFPLCKSCIGGGGGSASSDLVAGNAALCVSELARTPSGLAKLHAEGAIELIAPLTEVAHKRRGPAQKNAAIALARLAKCGEGGEYVAKLREHHAFEIIAKYVKV